MVWESPILGGLIFMLLHYGSETHRLFKEKLTKQALSPGKNEAAFCSEEIFCA